MTADDVKRVATASERAGEAWLATQPSKRQGGMYEAIARAAMAETLRLAAEKKRAQAEEWVAQGAPRSARPLFAVADWLEQRAKEVSDDA